MAKSHGITYDNCKDCESRCAHAGKNRSFVCIKGVSCKVKKEKPQTNADRIREMSDEELATWLGVNLDCMVCPVGISCMEGNRCDQMLLEWLKRPADGSKPPKEE